MTQFISIGLSKTRLDLRQFSRLRGQALLLCSRRLGVRASRLELLDGALNARLRRRVNSRGILDSRDTRLARLLRERRLAVQRQRLVVLALLIEGVNARQRPGEHIREGSDAARGADAQPPDQEIRLPAEGGEAVGGQLGRQPRDLGDGAARQLDADDAAVLLGQLRDGGRVEVDAVADGREVVDDDGQGALARDLAVEGVDHGRRRRLAEVRRRQHQRVVGARVGRVRDELERLPRRVPAASRQDGERGADGLPCRLHERLALLAGEQECFRVRP